MHVVYNCSSGQENHANVQRLCYRVRSQLSVWLPWGKRRFSVIGINHGLRREGRDTLSKLVIGYLDTPSPMQNPNQCKILIQYKHTLSRVNNLSVDTFQILLNIFVNTIMDEYIHDILDIMLKVGVLNVLISWQYIDRLAVLFVPIRWQYSW